MIYQEVNWSSHDGLRLYARLYETTAAAALTVLCLRGLTRNSRDFEDLGPHLQKRYRVVVPDVRTRGDCHRRITGTMPQRKCEACLALRAAPPATANLWQFWNALRGLPLLAIRGERSDILSAATFARMKMENPALVQLEVKERGHMPLLDKPECLAAIDAFLASVESSLLTPQSGREQHQNSEHFQTT